MIKIISDGKGRRALSSYLKYNFIPVEDSVPIAFHKKEQVSRTLEYAYDDYALFTVAKQLDKKDDEEKLFRRAFNYKNVFDTNRWHGTRTTMKMVNGIRLLIRIKEQFYITEGTPRQYTFYVPQDVPGLAKLNGR